MTVQRSRRAFLRGAFASAPAALRPYGAAADFETACTACGDCLPACPQAILTADRDGRPVVSFAENGCTFCGDCIRACEPGALRADRSWAWRATADAACLSANGIQCRACQDHCDAGAIRFRLQPGGRALAEFDAAACTGCGDCAAPCPTDAIRFAQLQPETEARPC